MNEPGNSTAIASRLGDAARRPENWSQLARFGLVGASGYLINLGVFALLAIEAGVAHQPAAVAAFTIAVVNNFFWNRYWTFDAGSDAAGFQALRFFVVSIASLGLNLAFLELLIHGGAVGSLPAQALAVALAMPFNFLGNKLWTFA